MMTLEVYNGSGEIVEFPKIRIARNTKLSYLVFF